MAIFGSVRIRQAPAHALRLMAQARSKGTLSACNFAGKSCDNLLVEATLCFPRLRSLGFRSAVRGWTRLSASERFSSERVSPKAI